MRRLGWSLLMGRMKRVRIIREWWVFDVVLSVKCVLLFKCVCFVVFGVTGLCGCLNLF